MPDFSDCRQTACSKEGTTGINVDVVGVICISRLLVHAVFRGFTGNNS